ncbi:MAG: hypothetical protein ACI88H_001368 [Cocleimonas sp.]|jgi:hypothetical protein
MDIKNLIIVILFISSLILTYIHFFQIDNYEQCVLKTMDGRNVKLTSFAKKVCRKEFPENIIDPFTKN